jgi:hypothetical protein
LEKAYDHEGSVTYELVVEPYDNLPRAAAIDSSTGRVKSKGVGSL